MMDGSCLFIPTLDSCILWGIRVRLRLDFVREKVMNEMQYSFVVSECVP